MGKAIEKQSKTAEDQEIKQVEALKPLKPEENQELESIGGLFSWNRKTNEIRKWEEKQQSKRLKI